MSEPLMATYNRLPVTFERGEGVWLWDTNGTRYLDALSGIAVCGLGHAHPAVSDAVCEQAGRLLHTSNLYGIVEQEAPGRAPDRTGRNGSRLLRQLRRRGQRGRHQAGATPRPHRRGIENPAILVAENSFHGRTLATLSATGNRKVQAGFEPLVQGFVRVPYDDLDAIETAAANRQQHRCDPGGADPGRGRHPCPGCRLSDPHPPSSAMRQGWLLMLDEIQTGMGAPGGCSPSSTRHPAGRGDPGQGLGNGVPIGACLARGEAAEVFSPGNHGSTFGGNPLACRAGLAVLETLIAGRPDRPRR
jgi:acetylornithine/N-succinyldiaminopimelate aminotransferase